MVLCPYNSVTDHTNDSTKQSNYSMCKYNYHQSLGQKAVGSTYQWINIQSNITISA